MEQPLTPPLPSTPSSLHLSLQMAATAEVPARRTRPREVEISHEEIDIQTVRDIVDGTATSLQALAGGGSRADTVNKQTKAMGTPMESVVWEG